jgi:tetratricopeptide (TPR) repeat protein
VTFPRTLFILPVLSVFLLLPFFEGGETSAGLFYIHSIILLTLAAAGFYYSRFWIPRYLFFFIPFLVVLCISTVLSAYHYAAFLKLWDYAIAGLWTILICTFIREKKDAWQSAYVWLFSGGAIASILTILLFNQARFGRIRGSFLNRNEFAVFALMLLCLGIYCLEKETSRGRKIFMSTLAILLLVSIGLSLSRGVFITSLLVAAAAFFRHKPDRTTKVILAMLIVVSGILVVVRIKYSKDPLQYYRWKIWKGSLQGVVEDPYFGVGLGMLEYRARAYNFPGSRELGRYGKIARSADSQYVEVLAETGFVGLVSFLFGWVGMLFSLQKASDQFFYLKLTWLIITVSSAFLVPLQNTAVLILFTFLIALATSYPDKEYVSLSFQRIGRIFIPVICFLLFVIGCYLPFQAHREFHLAARSSTVQEADQHLLKAVRYNPYQPYYRFFFIRRIVDSNPDWDSSRWLNLLSVLNQSIALNPVESEFYSYKARILRKLLQKELTLEYYSSAVASYQTALDYNPYNVFLRLEFAAFLYQIKRNSLAEIEVRKALEAEPAFLNARLFLTEVLLKRNDLEEAKKQYALFLAYYRRYGLSPKRAPTRYIRSLIEVNEKQKERIETLLKSG